MLCVDQPNLTPYSNKLCNLCQTIQLLDGIKPLFSHQEREHFNEPNGSTSKWLECFRSLVKWDCTGRVSRARTWLASNANFSQWLKNCCQVWYITNDLHPSQILLVMLREIDKDLIRLCKLHELMKRGKNPPSLQGFHYFFSRRS